MIYIPSSGRPVKVFNNCKVTSCPLLFFNNMEIGQKGKGTTHRYRAQITYKILYCIADAGKA
jgi:hypothetical protein